MSAITFKRMRPLWAADRGASAIEFALIAGPLCVLFLGLVDFGIGFWEQMQVTNAAQAAASYIQSNAYDASNVSTVAQNATSLPSLTVTSNTTCGCPNSSGVTTGMSCGSSCPSGGATAGGYVQINTLVSYTTLFPWPLISRPMTLQSSVLAICQNTGCS